MSELVDESVKNHKQIYTLIPLQYFNDVLFFTQVEFKSKSNWHSAETESLMHYSLGLHRCSFVNGAPQKQI